MPTAATSLDIASEPTEIEAARDQFLEVKQRREALVAEHRQVRLARDLATVPNLPTYAKRAAIAIAEAGSELTLARRSPKRTAVRLEDLENTIAELEPDFQDAKDRFTNACEVEAVKLRDEMLPRHRAATVRISKALEELSAALAEEIEVRDDFVRRAPAPGMSAPFPNFSAVFMSTAWMPAWDSRASAWHREAIAKGYLR